jgi:Tol biopolymer transport system component
MLALTEESKKGKATIYVMPLGGGKLRPVTKLVPSWWQGWSPDGKTLLFTGIRKDVALEVAPVPGLGGKGKDSYGILTIPAAGGEETALHAGDGDNPVYSADGKYIYFDSVRGGSRQVWRMLADGTKPEPVTNDEFVNWHPHASPDGQQLAFLSCDRSMAGNSGAKDIQVRSMALADRTIRVIANISGGDGTFDSAPWSADSKTLSFVSYQMVPQ